MVGAHEVHMSSGHPLAGTKGKLDEDVGQPGILTGGPWMSHTSPNGECGTSRDHQ